MTAKDKVAIITGGASGICLVLVKSFLEEGANVSVATVNQEASDKLRIARQKGVTFTTFLQM